MKPAPIGTRIYRAKVKHEAADEQKSQCFRIQEWKLPHERRIEAQAPGNEERGPSIQVPACQCMEVCDRSEQKECVENLCRDPRKSQDQERNQRQRVSWSPPQPEVLGSRRGTVHHSSRILDISDLISLKSSISADNGNRQIETE